MVNRLWRLSLTGLLSLAAACQQPQAASPVAPLPQVTVSRPVAREVVEIDEHTGRLDAVDTVEIRARVNGYLASVHFTDGAIVDKGALLFVIDRRPYQAELDRAKAALQQAMARHERTQKDFARAEQLTALHAISQEELDTRAADQREAEESVQAARAAVEAARLNVEFTEVRAPISGRIGRQLVTEGNLVNGGTGNATLLTTIVSLDPIYAYFEVDERAYLNHTRRLRDVSHSGGQDVKTPVQLGLATETGFPHAGHLDFIDNRLDPNTGTMTGRAIFPNRTLALVPGLFARIRLPGSNPYHALLIRDEAVGSDQTQRFALVVNERNTVEYRKIDLGPMIDGLRVVREGLRPDDWVIVNGVQRVRPGATVDARKGPMSGEGSPAGPARADGKARG